MDLSLSAADVTALAQRTEGWISGLQMAALSMRDRRDVSNFICTFTGSHVYIIGYLMEEVLQRQPPEMQTFLLCTAGLEIDFRLGVIESLPYPDATFDVVTSSLMIHHVSLDLQVKGFADLIVKW